MNRHYRDLWYTTASELYEAQEMLRYQTIKDKAYRVLDLTSLTVSEFEQLVEPFESAFVRHMQQWPMEGKPRTGRAYSQYANCPLPTREDRLLFILSYLKVANLQVAHGAMFDMSQSNANKWLHVLLLVLHQTLAEQGDALRAICWPWHSAWPNCVKRNKVPIWQIHLRHTPFYHDGSERPITRPQNANEQKAYYSGKKKRHTVAHVLLANEDCAIQLLSDTFEGSTHDKPIADTTPYPLPEGSELLQNLGFLGFRLSGVLITQPHKKPRGKHLSQEQKDENAVIAHRRVRVEHIICSVKRCRIVKDTIRLWKDTARDMVMAICCGLHNFRLRLNPWPAYH